MSILSYLLGEPKEEDLGIEVTDLQSFKLPIYSAPDVVPAETEERIKKFKFKELKDSNFHTTARRVTFGTGLYDIGNQVSGRCSMGIDWGGTTSSFPQMRRNNTVYLSGVWVPIRDYVSD